VSKHDRRAYFRIVPMQLAEARDLVQSIGSEHTSAAVSNIAQIPGGQKRKGKNNRNAIPKFKLSRNPVRVSAASLRGCHLYPDCAYPFASGPGPLAIGPFNRSIEEERRVQVLVRDNNVEQALKVLKKKMQREGVFREMKLRGHYEKPSERRVREKAEVIRRARNKLQREGLLPMKPRLVPGAPGTGGPARTPRF
jgi:small subunit ribosomal protein S21